MTVKLINKTRSERSFRSTFTKYRSNQGLRGTSGSTQTCHMEAGLFSVTERNHDGHMRI